MKVKVEIVSSDDIKICYTGKFQVYNKKTSNHNMQVSRRGGEQHKSAKTGPQKSVRTISRSLKYQRRIKEKNIMQISICEGEDHKSKNNRREKERGREGKI